MNSETLWDRLNDAVNTIIRRDETTETGDLLPPCVEGTWFLNFYLDPLKWVCVKIIFLCLIWDIRVILRW